MEHSFYSEQQQTLGEAPEECYITTTTTTTNNNNNNNKGIESLSQNVLV
jgi:hypothetical protein